jgi:hypothetical protein
VTHVQLKPLGQDAFGLLDQDPAGQRVLQLFGEGVAVADRALLQQSDGGHVGQRLAVAVTPICTASVARSWMGTGTGTSITRTRVPGVRCGGSGCRAAAGGAGPTTATTTPAATHPTIPAVWVHDCLLSSRQVLARSPPHQLA